MDKGCDKYRILLSSYIDNELDETSVRALEDHISRCNECKEELEALELIVKNLGELEDMEPPEDFHSGVMAAVELEKKANEKKNLDFINIRDIRVAQKNKEKNRTIWMERFRTRWKKYAAMASGVVGILIVLTVVVEGFSFMMDNSASSDTQVDSSNSYSTGSGNNIRGGSDKLALEQTTDAMDQVITVPETFAVDTDTDEAAATGTKEMAQTKQVADTDQNMQRILTDETARNAAYGGEMGTEPTSIKEYRIELNAYDYSDALEALKEYNSYSIQRSQNNSNSYHLVLQVPYAEYSNIIKKIKTLGKVENESEQIQRISADLVDTSMIVKAKEQEYARLMELLSKAETIENMIVVEERLEQLNYEISGNKNLLNTWNKNINNPSINIDVYNVSDKEGLQKETFGQKILLALISSVNGTRAVLEGLTVIVAALIIPGGLGGVVLYVIFIFCRRVRGGR